ncbi:MAG TPA: hypothetical protein V6C81_00875 [Planktothrix sp.]|jgi:hypothetical protein
MSSRFALWLENLIVRFLHLFSSPDQQRHVLEVQLNSLIGQAIRARKEYVQSLATEIQLRKQHEQRKHSAELLEKKLATAKDKSKQSIIEMRDRHLESAKHLATRLEEQEEKTSARKQRMQEQAEQAYLKKQIYLAYLKQNMLKSGTDDVYSSLIKICVAALIVGFALAVCYSLWF